MKILIIIGAAPNAKEDYENVLKMDIGEHDLLIVGKDAFKILDRPVKYFATYHPDDIILVRDKVEIVISHTTYMNNNPRIKFNPKDYKVDIIKPIDLRTEKSGSSALLGVLATIDEGYKKIILCGCPLTGKNNKQQPYSMFWPGWKQHEKEVRPYVKSMSGWTKELLGEPTIEWIKGEC